MRDKNKLLLIIFPLIIVLIVVILIIPKKEKKTNAVSQNINIELEKEVTELRVLESNVVKKEDKTEINFKIKNISNSVLDYKDVKLVVLDNKGNKLYGCYLTGMDIFQSGEERQYILTSDNDLSNATKYILKKMLK